MSRCTGEHREILLSRGLVSFVEASDYEELSRWKWYAAERHRQNYAVRTVRESGRRRMIYMHRQIFGEPADHRDRNGLNNCRLNLRAATKALNQANKSKQIGKYSSRFKGVALDKKTGRWMARITVENKPIWLGRFSSEIKAALAYNLAAVQYFGEFACLNEV